MKLTKKQQRLVAYNDIITKNKSAFKAGMSMDRADFIAMFNIQGIVDKGKYKDIQNSNLRLVQAQSEINMLMRENGLCMKSKDYYSKFLVADKEATKNTIIRYSSEIDRYDDRAMDLENRMDARIQRKTWGTYNRVNAKLIPALGKFSSSNRHENTKNRVKHF